MPRAESASVVSELTAFLKEPARHRPRYTHGREALEGGHHVFRFAQGKFPPGLMHDTPTHRREELRQAAAAFVRQVCFWDGATHYQVLCVDPLASGETIKEHYHLLMGLIHPDRAANTGEHFPASWAQRANDAYAVLSEPARRAAYDGGLAAVRAGAGVEAPHVPRAARERVEARSPASRRKLRLAKGALVAAVLVATLATLDAWYGESRDYALFHGLGRFARSGELPRFLTGEPTSFTQPALAASEPAVAEKPAVAPARHATPRVAKPDAPASAAMEDQAHGSAPEPAAVATRAVAPPFVAAPPPLHVAQADPAKPAEPAAALTSADIETLVVRMIGAYEAGEADRLMALVASDEGYWQRSRLRQTYEDFFRATRERRLHIDSLQWDKAASTARAHGEARLEALYVDDARTLDRKVSVELTIGLRDGEAKITRLSLYPNAP